MVVGTTYNVPAFRRHTSHASQIAGTILGNYDHLPITEWSLNAWNVFRTFLEYSKSQFIKQFEEKQDAGFGIAGIEGAWVEISVGNCETLLVEEDFLVQAYSKVDDPGNICINPPAGQFIIHGNIVEEMVNKALHNSAAIKIMPNGSLSVYNGVALITRIKVSEAENHALI